MHESSARDKYLAIMKPYLLMWHSRLYAIWAIPAALLFWGVGAGISRRVFAKHPVS